MVFSHCHGDGLGTLVMEEVGCQAGRRGTGASERKLTMARPVLAPRGIQTKDCIGPQDSLAHAEEHLHVAGMCPGLL